MVKCCLVGCKSSSKENWKIKFIKFPKPNSPLYYKWIRQCQESICVINVHPKPYVCSEHFSMPNNDRITENSIPTLKLNPSANAKIVLGEETQIKDHFMNMINETLLEWSMRAHHYPKIAPECRKKTALTALASELLNMLNPEIDISFNNTWWETFEAVLIARLKTCDLNKSYNKSLVLANILKQLYPMVNFYNGENVVSKGGVELNVDQDLKALDHDGINKKDKEQCSDVITSITSGEKEACESIENSRVEICSQPNAKSEFIIDSYSDALEYIKTLEDFTLEQDDSRATGMLSSLKDILQSHENSD